MRLWYRLRQLSATLVILCTSAASAVTVANAQPGIIEYPIPTAGSGPSSITAGSDGALWFTEFNSHKIGRITTNGDFIEFPLPTTNAEAAEHHGRT